MLRTGLKAGFVDRPDGDLKSHSGSPVPLGGIGVFAAVHFGLIAIDRFEWALFWATLAVLALGLIDDRRSVSPILRLYGVASAALLMGILSPNTDGFEIVAMMVAVVVVVNAINLFDGLDGLVAGTGTVSAVAFIALVTVAGLDSDWSSGVLGAALVGFLVWNRPPARLYLGDNGSYVVGVALAWFATQPFATLAGSLTGLALIGVPLIDLAATILRRLRHDKPLFGGDRDHSYDRLHKSGRSVADVAVAYTVAQIIWVGLVIGLTAWGGLVVAAIGAAGVLLSVAVLVGWQATESPAAAS